MADLTPIDALIDGLDGKKTAIREMAGATDLAAVRRLADWAVEVQRRHVEVVRAASLKLAAEEVATAA